MNNPLTFYEFEKLAALINGICLLIVMVLYTVFIRIDLLSTFVIGIIVALLACFVIAFLRPSKAERLLANRVRLWNAKHIAMDLSISLACALTGFLTTVIYVKVDIAILMIVLLSGYLGINLGHLAKIKYRYRKHEL